MTDLQSARNDISAEVSRIAGYLSVRGPETRALAFHWFVNSLADTLLQRTDREHKRLLRSALISALGSAERRLLDEFDWSEE